MTPHDLALFLVGFCACGLLEWAVWLFLRLRNLRMRGFSVWEWLRRHGLGTRVAETVCAIIGHALTITFTAPAGVICTPTHERCLRCDTRVPTRRDA